MSSNWINLKGTISWAKVYEPDEPSFGDKRWKVSFYPMNDDEWAIFDKSGMQMEKKEDQDGKKFVTFRRACKKLFPKDDEATFFNPPEITGAVNVSYVNPDNNEKVRSYKKSEIKNIKIVGEQTEIGNGSVCIVNLCVYDGGKGKGHRLESINVLDLVEYKRERQQAVEEKVEAKSSKLKDDLNDELPF